MTSTQSFWYVAIVLSVMSLSISVLTLCIVVFMYLQSSTGVESVSQYREIAKPKIELRPVSQIELFGTSIKFDECLVEIPIAVEKLEQILGEPRKMFEGGLCIWDKHGLKAYVRVGIVTSLDVHFSTMVNTGLPFDAKSHESTPVTSFHGVLVIRSDLPKIRERTVFTELSAVGFGAPIKDSLQMQFGDRMHLFAYPDYYNNIGAVDISLD